MDLTEENEGNEEVNREIGFPSPPRDGCPKLRDRFAESGREKVFNHG